MKIVVGVKFKENGKLEYYSPENLELKVGDGVICEGPIGIQYGEIALANTEIDEEKLEEIKPLNPIIRLATEKDKEKVKQNKEKAISAFLQTQQIIKKYDLEMKLLEAEYSLDLQKLMFTFSAEDRVDFRELVKELAQIFKVRIELRQIGIRDEVKLIGGIGPCGRIACCKSFLNDYGKVGIKMAKQQALSLSPTKINGICGKIMCCIAFENDTYVQNLAVLPKVNQRVKTPEGKGVVMYVNILEKKLTIKILEDEERLVVYPVEEISIDE